MSDSPPFEMVSQQSTWYGELAHRDRSSYIALKTIQIIVAAAIPVVAVGAVGDIQRWTSAISGALVGIIEGVIQLGQYQQNWLLYRATREALKREELLHSGKAGPYAGVPDPDALLIERSDAIVSGENSRSLASQEQAASRKQSHPP